MEVEETSLAIVRTGGGVGGGGKDFFEGEEG